MRRKFDIAIDIDAPAARVWEVMSDVERWHEWTASITSIRKLDAGPLKLGGRARVVQPTLLPAVWTSLQEDETAEQVVDANRIQGYEFADFVN